MRKNVKKNSNAVLVVTAVNQYKEKNYHLKSCVHELEELGAAVDIFDIDKQDGNMLLNYDVVEFLKDT